jgi:hypothetical protein
LIRRRENFPAKNKPIKYQPMNTQDLLALLRQKVKHRVDIYMAQSKIDTYFKDQGFLTNEVAISDKEGAEFGVSVFNIISGKVSGGVDVCEKLVLDSRDKGKIIEKIANISTDTIDRNIAQHKNGLFQYKGPAHYTYWGESINIYSSEENAHIQKERERQEKILEKNTVLFTFKIDDTIYASIANKENFDLGMLASYGPLPSHCLLGLVERKLTENIMLINPFWIWYEEE